MRWVGHVASVRDNRGAYRVLVGKTEGEKPLGKLWHRQDDKINMDLQDIG